MSVFYIHPSNLERLEKKLLRIQNKCKKYNVDFKFEKLREEMVLREDSDGHKDYVKYTVANIEGFFKFENWEFVATIDHHAEGNIIRAFNTELEIPERYKTCNATCEHCKKIRSRKDTYLIFNRETNEFKQVGKSCLNEFTNGLDAESAAMFAEFFTATDSYEGCGVSSFNRYTNVEETLRYAFECFRHFGYEKAWDEYGEQVRHHRTTRDRVSDYMRYDRGDTRFMQIDKIEDELSSVGFDAKSEYTLQRTADALKWIAAEDTSNNGYLNNLRIICSESYTELRNFGMLVSLPAAYDRYLQHKEYVEKKKAEDEKLRNAEAASQFQGEIGQRITITCKGGQLITSWDTIYGTTYLYKFVDDNNNVYTWFASSVIPAPEEVTTVIGTIKQHQEYDGVKQTILTRCKCK